SMVRMSLQMTRTKNPRKKKQHRLDAVSFCVGALNQGRTVTPSLPWMLCGVISCALLRQTSLLRCSHIIICSAPQCSFSLYCLLFTPHALPAERFDQGYGHQAAL